MFMIAARLLLAVSVCVALVACQKHEDKASPAPAKPAASALQPPYPHCPVQGVHVDCHDLGRQLDPGDYVAADFARVDLPLQQNGHEATASGLAGADAFLADILVLPSGKLYAVGGAGLKVAMANGTADTHWHVVQHSDFADTLHRVTFVDAQRGFAVGTNGEILRTQDAGQHWELFNRLFSTGDDPAIDDLKMPGDSYAVAFADASHGVIVGEDRIFRSIDGGQQWQRVPQSLDHIALQDLQFVDARRGWAVGSAGTVRRTDDAGEHWTAVTLGTDVHLMGVSFADAAHGCIGGGYKVWCSEDGGQHWQAADVAVPKDLDPEEAIAITRLRMGNGGHGWFITRDGLIFATVDGGHHWTPWMDVVKASQGKLNGVELWGLALGHDRAWAVGTGGFAAADAQAPPGAVSLASSPLILSWPL
jgi:photosystem II stability/assembly factor-like uncharacterized protein